MSIEKKITTELSSCFKCVSNIPLFFSHFSTYFNSFHLLYIVYLFVNVKRVCRKSFDALFFWKKSRIRFDYMTELPNNFKMFKYSKFGTGEEILTAPENDFFEKNLRIYLGTLSKLEFKTFNFHPLSTNRISLERLWGLLYGINKMSIRPIRSSLIQKGLY